MVWSSRRCKKRYNVVKSGTLTSPNTLAQFAMLAQTHLSFMKSPIFVTHQRENGQQLRLGKLAFAEMASVARAYRRRDLQGATGKGKSPTTAIARPASIENYGGGQPGALR